jgi:hypothetical protein
VLLLRELGRFETDYPDNEEVDVPARLQIHHFLDRKGNSDQRGLHHLHSRGRTLNFNCRRGHQHLHRRGRLAAAGTWAGSNVVATAAS